MSEPQPAEITQLLGAMRAGDEKAADTVVNLAYDELKIIAHRQLNRLPSGGTLNTTAVVHAAFLKLNVHAREFAHSGNEQEAAQVYKTAEHLNALMKRSAAGT